MGDQPLAHSICNPPASLLDKKVSDFINEDRLWDFRSVTQWLNLEQQGAFSSIFIASLGVVQDKRIWESSANVTYSSKEGNKWISSIPVSGKQWRWVWKMHVPNKMCMFIWLAGPKRSLTNQLRQARGLHFSNLCDRCQTHKEDVRHVLRDSPRAGEVWGWLVEQPRMDSFFTSDLQSWILSNGNMTLAKDWHTTLVVPCWVIWCSRCKEVIENHIVTTGCQIRRIQGIASDCDLACNSTRHEVLPRAPRLVSWTPAAGVVKINVDGSSRGNPGKAGAGALLRDYLSVWIDGF